MEASEVKNYEVNMKLRPHVVILGAGATMATIPNGDRYGNKSSVMSGFIKKLGMDDLLKSINTKTKSDNLEDIYSELSLDQENKDILTTLETRIYEYFSGFVILKEPTVYDFLILSLTKKDIVASFNWDPLLLQAYRRVKNLTDNLPSIVFLHGNVAIGICEADKIAGPISLSCSKCKKPYAPVKLLYPVANKDYISNLYITESWKELNFYLKKAYMLTIFGYSAPKTDIDAINLLKTAWGNKEDRNLEEIEIIDTKDDEDLRSTWSEFIHTHHYSTYIDFFKSSIASFPRRSCEAMFDQLMNCMFLDNTKGFQPTMTFADIKIFINPLLIEEERAPRMLSNPYI
jgi:hypothetical protein